MTHQSKIIHFMPTICWMIFMVIPFFLTIYLTSGGTEKSLHLISLMIATFFILSGDIISFRKKEIFSSPKYDSISLYHIGLTFSLISIFGLMIQLTLLENIPFIESLKGATGVQVQIFREESSKLLSIPSGIKYFFNWCTDLLPILGLACLFLSKRKIILSIYILVFFSLSLLFDVQQTPLRIITLLPLLILSLRNEPFSKIEKKGTLIVASFCLIIGITSILIDKSSMLNPFSDSYVPIQKMTEAHRSPNLQRPNVIAKKIEFLLYRAILVPIEVTSHWYDYYTNHEEKIGLSDIGIFRLFQTKSSELSASRKIGYYYYHRTNPDKYLNTVSANASFDADAYAHFGVWGVLSVSILLLMIRLLLTYLTCNNSLSLVLRNMSILVLSITLPQASIQAILVPQGLIVILFLMAFLKYYQPLSLYLFAKKEEGLTERN